MVQVEGEKITNVRTQAAGTVLFPFFIVGKERSADTLPFVGYVGKGDDRRLSYWEVQPTGRWDDDNILGRAYAIEALRFALGKQWPALLKKVIEEFPRAKKYTGIEHGFLEIITDCALCGAMELSHKATP